MRVPLSTGLPKLSRTLLTSTTIGRSTPSATVEVCCGRMLAESSAPMRIRASATGVVPIRLPLRVGRQQRHHRRARAAEVGEHAGVGVGDRHFAAAGHEGAEAAVVRRRHAADNRAAGRAVAEAAVEAIPVAGGRGEPGPVGRGGAEANGQLLRHSIASQVALADEGAAVRRPGDDRQAAARQAAAARFDPRADADQGRLAHRRQQRCDVTGCVDGAMTWSTPFTVTMSGRYRPAPPAPVDDAPAMVFGSPDTNTSSPGWR